MTLADFTAPEMISPALPEGDAHLILNELWSALDKSGKLPRSMVPWDVLRNRVMYGVVEMSGWALPHMRIPGLKKTWFAFGKRTQPITWPGCRGMVDAVFLLAAPEDEAGEYLGVLSCIARLARDPARLLQLRRTQDSAAVCQLFESLPVLTQQRHSVQSSIPVAL